MSTANPSADGTSADGKTAGGTTTADATARPVVSIPALEAEITARRERLATTIDELTDRISPRSILHRQTEAAKGRFADVATTPEGELRVERIAAVVAVVAVLGGLVLYRRLRHG
jgi:hypothetical protein